MLFSKNNCVHRIRSLSYQFNNNYSCKLSFKLLFFLHIDNYAKKNHLRDTIDYLIIRIKILIHCTAIVVICIALVAIPGFMISVAPSFSLHRTENDNIPLRPLKCCYHSDMEFSVHTVEWSTRNITCKLCAICAKQSARNARICGRTKIGFCTIITPLLTHRCFCANFWPKTTH